MQMEQQTSFSERCLMRSRQLVPAAVVRRAEVLKKRDGCAELTLPKRFEYGIWLVQDLKHLIS